MMDAGQPQENLPPTTEAAFPEYVEPALPTDAAAGLWTLRNLVIFLAFSFVAFFCSNQCVLAGYELLKPRMGWHLSDRALGENPFFLIALQSVFYLFILLYLYLLVAINHRQPFWKAMAWRQPTFKQTLTCLGGGIVLAAVVLLAPPLLPETREFPLQRLFSSAAAGYAVGSFAILVAPPLEELVFRGFLFRIFEHRVGLRCAVLATAMLFAGLHVPEYWGAWNHALLILVVGLVFSFARGLTGSLAPSVILHAAYNTCMIAGLYFTTQHFRTLQGILTR
jgi:membrane protease YdiL (CAAX protease family)